MIDIQTSETMLFAAKYNYNISLILGEVAKTTFVDTSQSECSIGDKEPTFNVAANRSTPVIYSPFFHEMPLSALQHLLHVDDGTHKIIPITFSAKVCVIGHDYHGVVYPQTPLAPILV